MTNISIRLALFFILALLSVGFGFVFPPLIAALVGSSFLLALIHFYLRLNVAEFLALPRDKKAWLETLVAFAFGLIFVFILQSVLSDLQPEFSIPWSESALQIIFAVPFQAFFEEILFRGVFLKNLFLRSISLKWVSLVAMALVFSLSHFFNYLFTENLRLSAHALFSLFLLGFAGNLVFLRQGHLGGAWGFHAGWNTLRYSVVYQFADKRLSEGESFNVLEGSGAGIMLGVMLSGAVFLFVKRSQPPAANANLYPR